MTILKANITLTGKRSILFNHFSRDSIPLEKRELTGKPGNDPEEWKRSILMTKERQLYVEGSYIFGCLRAGGKEVKVGRASMQAKIASTLLVLDEIILLDRFVPLEEDLTEDKDQPVYLDVRSVSNPNTKGRNIRYRIAAAPGWRISFQIEWENTIVSTELMQSAVMNAGSYVGLGDGRNIGFGRFDIESFEIEEAKAQKIISKKKKTA